MNRRLREAAREKPQQDPQEKAGEKTDRERDSWWNRLKSGSGRRKGFPLKKDQLLIGLLTGILLIVIAWPVDSKKNDQEKAREGSGWGNEVSSSGDGGESSTLTLNSGQAGNDSTSGQVKAGSISGASSASDAYTREMENRLAEALSQVEGVGRVRVLITWKSSSEKVVEKDAPGNSQKVEETDSSGGTRTTVEESSEESTVYLEGEDGSRTPYVVKEIQPLAEGVLVIAEGGGNAVTAQQILEAVQALFPLDTHKIKIMKMEGSK